MMIKASKASERGDLPGEQVLARMMRFNDELAKAGVLLDLSGLQPSRAGARVRFSGGQTTVVDGPFSETKELIAGYWLIQVKDRAEAIEWARRVPAFGDDGAMAGEDVEIEVRPLYEMTDFPDASAETLAKAASLLK